MSNAADNAIEVQGLECRQGERTILHDVNFTVARGELVFVIGVSGCGKSTLLKHLIGLLPVGAGRIAYFGRDFTAAGPSHTRCRRARTPRPERQLPEVRSAGQCLAAAVRSGPHFVLGALNGRAEGPTS